jgi:hypothetical protein
VRGDEPTAKFFYKPIGRVGGAGAVDGGRFVPLWALVGSHPASDPMLVKTFLERYSEPERQSEMLPNVVLQIDTE